MGNDMRAARFLAILILLAAIIAAALYLLRLPLAGWAVRSAMAGAGLENPQARVTALTLEGVRVENITAGPTGREAFRLDRAEADYNWRRLLSERTVEAVRVGPGLLRLTISDDGAVSVPGLSVGGSEKAGGDPPFSKLSVKDIVLEIDAPDGQATGALNAELDTREGGAAAATLTTSGAGWKNYRVAEGEADLDIHFSVGGEVKFSFGFKGDAEAYGASASGATFNIEGEAASWRNVVNGAAERPTGRARIAFDAPRILFSSATLPDVLSPAPVEAAFGGRISEAALAGAFDAALTADGFEFRLAPSKTAGLTTPDGAAVTLAASGGAPLYVRKGEREMTSFAFSVKSEGVNASGAVDAEKEGGILRVAAPVKVEEYTSPQLAITGSMLDFAATVEGDRLAADLFLRSHLQRAKIGRLALSDTPLSSAFRVNADLAAKTADIHNNEDCIAMERVHGRLEEQNAEAVLGRTQLCNTQGPLAVVAWSDNMVCSLSGEISSEDGRFRMGATRAAGRPPNVQFSATYEPSKSRTTIDGALSNGAMTLNDAFHLSAALGRFDFTLDKEKMRANGIVDRVRIAQNLETPLIAPVLAEGRVTLEGMNASFDYDLATPSGAPLGVGEGTHDMATASGRTVFTFDGLRFAPKGLQPNELALGLKGIISGAEGGVDGTIRFGWSPEGVTSGADFRFNDITFDGPTRAVTRTIGVSGDIAFSDLLPAKTNGVQTVTVRTVDLSALQLQAGEISFELPGDDTLYLSRGEFPWFGGTIGAYEAAASFAGEATIPLRAENVDLKRVFEFVDADGLSGEGILSGSLPIVFEDGKARIENGELRSQGPGAIRYTGAAAQAAEAAGENAQIAFDILRDLRYESLYVTINGALDGELMFNMKLEGVGDLSVRNQRVRDVPVIYRINLTLENADLISQANIKRRIQTQIQEILSRTNQ